MTLVPDWSAWAAIVTLGVGLAAALVNITARFTRVETRLESGYLREIDLSRQLMEQKIVAGDEREAKLRHDLAGATQIALSRMELDNREMGKRFDTVAQKNDVTATEDRLSAQIRALAETIERDRDRAARGGV